jgi:hypothetical protein
MSSLSARFHFSYDSETRSTTGLMTSQFKEENPTWLPWKPCEFQSVVFFQVNLHVPVVPIGACGSVVG